MCLACCSKFLCNPKSYINGIEDKKKIPTYMKMDFINKGYRLHHDFWDCVGSLFRMHNETFNIWTALLPFFYFVSITVQLFKRGEVPFLERTFTIVYTLTACFSFAASTLFHMCSCISKRAHIKLIQLDMIGIALLIGGSYYPATYFVFQEQSGVYITYLAIITLLTLTCCVIFVVPKFAMGYHGFRIATFASVAGFGLVIISHMLIQHGLSKPEIVGQILRIFGMYAMYGLGVVFYATKFPECIAGPNSKFTQYFHSHNIWHLFVFLGTFVHYMNVESCLLAARDIVSTGIKFTDP